METNSTLWQRFGEHIDETFIIVVLLLVALVALAVAVMFLDGVANYLQHLLGLNENGKYKALQTIGFCIAGVLLVWQAWAANKRADAMENTANSTAAGQQEERLKNAIEHLGHKKNTSVRISGAYELFHLAKDTENLRQTVLKILCAHIRQTAKGQTATDQTTHEKDCQAKHEKKPSEEIQCMLTLFFAQKDNIFKGCPINLQGSYLKGANLSKARLQNANLRDAQLQGANLFKAQLQGANLMETQLQGVSSQEADHFSSVRFESRIRDRIGEPSDLTGIIFAGGLQQEDLDTLCEGLSDGQAQALRKKLELHVGQPASNELPVNSGAKTGAYTREEAEQWIAEYNKAI